MSSKIPISNLEGLQYFKHLKAFEFNRSNISDVTIFLQMPRVQAFDCATCKIQDVSGLKDLPRVRLQRQTPKLNHFPPAFSTQKRTDLDLVGNALSDLSHLKPEHAHPNNNFQRQTANTYIVNTKTFTTPIKTAGGALVDLSPSIAGKLSSNNGIITLNSSVQNNEVISATRNDTRFVNFNGTINIKYISTNLAPTDIILSSTTIAPNLTLGTEVGTLSTIDPDTPTGHQYRLLAGAGDEDNALFSIQGEKLIANFSPATKNSYSIRIEVDDGNGGRYEKILTITRETDLT
ncbi:MAG: hypothetical protein Q4B28_03415 [bacterium]|nr:hypothetical protein [bacterium]